MGAAGGLDIWTGVMCSPVFEFALGVKCNVGGLGIDSGARAALTKASGFGKRTAMSGASGREREYDKRDPVAVMKVNSPKAGIGSRRDPTKMFYSYQYSCP